MSGKIAILTIHGIGQQNIGFANDFHMQLLEKIYKNHTSKIEIKCFEFEWQHLVEPQEENLFNKINDLWWNKSRYIALTFIGDAISYAKDSQFYKNVHIELDKKLQEINSWLDEDGKIYIIAHSLGSIIVYDYIYNLQNFSAKGNLLFRATDVNVIDKLNCLFTVGSPLYIYSLQKDQGGKPIKTNRWLNIYSKFDIIGYPIKTINSEFENSSFIEDKAIVCGNLLKFWNPMSHITYFDSNNFINLIASEVNK